MRFRDTLVRRPLAVGVVCAVGAVLLGLAYMAAAGAPGRYLAINGGALVVGLLLLAVVSRSGADGRRRAGLAVVGMAVVLLATALLGDAVEGAARWVRLGPVVVQPSLVLVPAMILMFVRGRDWLCAVGMVGAAAALAMQPDRGMAFVLAAGLAVVAVRRPNGSVLAAFGAGLVALAVTMARGDALPAVPYVDRIFYTAFEVHVLAGLAVVGGAGLLLVPAVAAWLGRGGAGRDSALVFGAVWLAAILAAALGNYPTPVVGYGGSAVIGYVLSLAWLGRAGEVSSGAGSVDGGADEGRAARAGLLGSPHRYWILAILVAGSLHYGWGELTRTRGDQIVSFRAARQDCGSMGRLLYCVNRDAGGVNGDVVYHLHGRNQDARMWNHDSYYTAMVQGEWQRDGVRPPTVVTVSYGGTWLLAPRGSRAESGLLEDLMARLPAIEARIGAPRRRMLLGESMGGLNVLVAGLTYPERFAKVAALCPGVYATSPFASLSTIRAAMVRTGASPKIGFGIWLMGRRYVSGDAEWRRISPLHLIERAGAGSPALYLSNGLYDAYGNFEGTQRLAAAARARGVRTVWRPLYGGHCATDVPSLARFLVE
ncbi:MAG TPA: alpha/beta hydrolase-fold protein [Allosphingosinicella sp.]